MDTPQEGVQVRARSALAGIEAICRLAVIALVLGGVAGAQDLAPRSYVITPVHANAVTLSWSFFRGDLNLSGALPVGNAKGTFSVSAISYYRAFSFFGRSANFTVLVPYGIGTFRGETSGTQVSVYRSGLVDSAVRFAVNLKGGPAMALTEFARWKQKTLLGVSVRVIAPTGQYDPTKVINWGINRWAVKPEFGYSHRRGKWLLDGYGGMWFYSENPALFSLPAPKPQTRSPIASLEGHLMYDLKPRLWFSLDGNFWYGGSASVEGKLKPETTQTSSRLGATASFPLNRHQSIKVSYSTGAYSRFGAKFQQMSLAWQYAWVDKPR